MNRKPSSARLAHSSMATAAAALVWASAPAAAADLGGSCCADLEERTAELEATAVRKGNRKLSLTISGQVNQAIMFWDDGDERNVYQLMSSNSSDRVRFEGEAILTSDLRAGYYLELGHRSSTTAGATQLSASSGERDMRLRNSVMFVESKTAGALSMGFASPATDDITGYNLGGTNVAGSSDVSRVGGGLFTRDSNFGGTSGLNSLSSGNTMSLRWRRFTPELDTAQANLIRYDSPVLAGFAVSASWGEDDFWDVALRFAHANEHFKIAMGAGFFETTTEDDDTFGWPQGGDNEPNNGNTAVREMKGSASIMHVPTGLFVSGAYVHREFSGSDLGMLTFACFGSADAAAIRSQGIACGNRPDFDYYWVNAGIKQKLIPLGPTSFYGEFGRSEDAITGLNVSVRSAAGGDIDYVTSSAMEVWGVGVVQHVRAAGMDVYFSYRNFSADVVGRESSGAQIVAPIEDTDLFLAGSRIRF